MMREDDTGDIELTEPEYSPRDDIVAQRALAFTALAQVTDTLTDDHSRKLCHDMLKRMI